MKIADVRAKTDDELKKQVLDLYKEEMNLRFEHANGQLKDTAKIRRTRRDIARIQTVLTERRLGIEVANDTTKKVATKKTTASKKEKATTAKKKAPAKKKAAAKKADK